MYLKNLFHGLFYKIKQNVTNSAVTKNKSINIDSVAEKAGVSKATVSRVLNGDFKVKYSTAERVQQVADELGYKLPSKIRRSSRVANGTANKAVVKTRQIAFVFPDRDARGMSTELARSLEKGIEQYLYNEKIVMIPCHFAEDGSPPLCIQRKQADGYILRGMLDEKDWPRKTIEEMHRFAGVDLFCLEPNLAIDSVIPDNDLLGRLAARELADRGKKQCTVIAVGELAGEFQNRIHGFRYEAEKLDIKMNTLIVNDCSELLAGLSSSDEHESIFPAWYMDEVFTSLQNTAFAPSPDLPWIMSVNSTNEAVKFRGDSYICINIRAEDIGRAAAEQLYWRLENPQSAVRRIMIQPEIVK